MGYTSIEPRLKTNAIDDKKEQWMKNYVRASLLTEGISGSVGPVGQPGMTGIQGPPGMPGTHASFSQQGYTNLDSSTYSTLVNLKNGTLDSNCIEDAFLKLVDKYGIYMTHPPTINSEETVNEPLTISSEKLLHLMKL